MVRTRFAWLYGGRDVSLCGSFLGWTDRMPMTLLEGSSVVFQIICDLPPGYHQYKFLVDGVWRHDKQQPCVTDEYGIVNNIILVSEPQTALSGLCPVAPIIQPNMEVDNGPFQNMGSSVGVMHREPMAQLPDVDINVSRSRISLILSSYTAYELLPESGKVSILDVKLPVKRAFHIMYEQGLAVVPIWDDSRGQFLGMLTASDFILILRELHNNGSMLSNEELEMHSISAWKEEKLRLNRQSDGPVQQFRRPLIQNTLYQDFSAKGYNLEISKIDHTMENIMAGPHESLNDVALRILQNEISVVPIIYSPMPDGSYSQLLHLACLPGILKWTWAAEMGVASRRQLIVLKPNAPLSSALNLLMEAQVSSIPIVDDNGSLLDVYSRSDITTLAKGGAYANIRLDEMSMRNALQLGYDANNIINGPRCCQTCLRTDTLHEIMERLSDPVVRRLIIIEAGSNRVQGIISLRDVFSFLLG